MYCIVSILIIVMNVCTNSVKRQVKNRTKGFIATYKALLNHIISKTAEEKKHHSLSVQSFDVISDIPDVPSPCMADLLKEQMDCGRRLTKTISLLTSLTHQMSPISLLPPQSPKVQSS